MKKTFILLSFLLVCRNASALPNSDSFIDSTATPGGTLYAIGNPLATQTNSFAEGWGLIGSGNAGTAEPLIAGGNLTYPGLPESVGNSVSIFPGTVAAKTARVGLNLTATPTSVYYSFILKVTDISAVGTGNVNNFIAAISDTVGAQSANLSRAGARLLTKKVGTDFVLGISKSTVAGEMVYDSTPRVVGDVLFVVAAYERIDGLTNVSLWINPPASSFGSVTPPTANVSTTNGSAGDVNANAARAFVISCQTTTMPSATLDEVRVGRTWAFVTGGPEIRTQPASMTRNAGTNAVLTVVARGTLPLFYQWQKDGTNLVDGGNIFGANTTSLTVSNLLASDSGAYTVIVTNSYGSATSSVATLTVTDPSINSQPLSQTLPPGTNAVFNVVAGGTPALTYQWVKDDTIFLIDGGNISGAQTSTLTVSNISAADVGTYSVFVTNGLGNFIQSTNASLSIADPAITSQPQNRTNDFGTIATFQVSVLGTPPFSYQWNKVGVGPLTDAGNISGSQSNLLTLTGVSFTDAGEYYVTVTNSLNTVDSANALLTVRDPIIVTNPVSMIVANGSNVVLTVSASGTPTFSYQWRRSATNILDEGNWSGTTSDTLTIANISTFEAGTYSVVVTGGSGNSATSSNAVVTVLNPVVITNQPVSQTVVSGTNVTFSVSATGTAPLHYQWMLNDVEIPNANLNVYTIGSAQTNHVGNYTVVITNSINSVTSAPASLTILELPPTIYAQPSSRTIAPGTRAVFVVGASGSLPLNYQWQRDGTNISGANSMIYSIASVQPSDAAVYTVIVSNSVNSVTSAPAILIVTTNLPLYENNLVVVRIGDGAQTLALTGNSIYLDQFTTSGSYVNTITIPEQGAFALIATGPDLTGTTLTGTALTRTPDKRFMVLGGYNANVPYGSNLNAANGTDVPRGIGLVDLNGAFTLAHTDTVGYSTRHIRAAAFDGTNNFWGAGNGQGTQYFGTNAPGAVIQTDYTNTRMIDIFNGNLYGISSQSGNSGVFKFTGLPTEPTTVTSLIGPSFDSANTTDFSFDPAGTNIYITVGNTVQKWQFDGTIWTNLYALNIGTLTRYMAVDFSSAEPVLYVTTSSGQLMSIADSGTNAVPTTIATAGINQLFKGIRFAPIGNSVTTPTLTITRNGNNVILTWNGNFNLQSASEVVGTYSTISGATSPYTNSVTLNVRLFFRLKD